VKQSAAAAPDCFREPGRTRTLARRAAPGALLVIAAGALVLVPPLRAAFAPLLPASPYAVFGAGMLLAWRFRRAGAALAFAVLALAEIALRAFGADAGGSARATDTVAILLPIDLLLVLSLGVAFGRRTASTALAVLAAEAFTVLLVARPEAYEAGALLGARLVAALPARIGALSQPAVVAFVVALALAGVRFLRDAGPISGGAVWAMIAAALGLASGPGLDATTWLATAGVVLAVSVVEASHGLVYADPLTGLPARRALEEHLGELSGTYTIAMIDIDHFKRVNDEQGHAVGDQVLRMIAATLERPGGGGIAYRYGGEEFTVVFAGRTPDEVGPALERLRTAIESTPFVLRGGDRPSRKPERPRSDTRARRHLTVTVSIGVASDASRGCRTSHDVIVAADAALYRAKRAGRNRVST
jgi:diguanylate cyclase (GGDEF)-like protein